MKIRFHETKPDNPVKGDAWYDDFGHAEETIAEQHRGKRPIRVQVADNTSFMIYSRAYNQKLGWHGNGWNVSGEPHDLTLSPSVNMEPYWHGFITKGELTP